MPDQPAPPPSFDAHAAAAGILELRRTGRPLTDLPMDTRPAEVADGYAAQAALHKLQETTGTRFAGYKVGCTSKVMQDYMGVDHPAAGRVPADSVWQRFTRYSGAETPGLGVELEIAVRLGASIAAGRAPHSRGSVSPAIAALMPAFEVVQNRFGDFKGLGAPFFIADDFFAHSAVLGDEVAEWRALDLPNLTGTLSINGTQVADGIGAAILGHPLDSLVWLADHLSAQGLDLEEGQIVLLGSMVKTHWFDAGEEALGRIEGLGEVKLRVD